MSSTQNAIDAGFFQLIHQLAQAPRDTHAECREAERRQLACFLKIAPWDGTGFPRDSDFSLLRCNDLARRGFSFLSAREPDFTRLVAAFAIPGEPLFLSAKIVRIEPVLFHASGRIEHTTDATEAGAGPGRTRMFLAGCRFLGRLHKPAAEA